MIFYFLWRQATLLLNAPALSLKAAKAVRSRWRLLPLDSPLKELFRLRKRARPVIGIGTFGALGVRSAAYRPRRLAKKQQHHRQVAGSSR